MAKTEKRLKTKQCGKKVKYPTQETAEKGLVFFHGENPDFNTYHCPHCDYWHVGHKMKPKTLVMRLRDAKMDFIDWTEHE